MIDLFAGAGGLSLGMEQAGFDVIFANEIDATSAYTYIKNRQLSKDRFFEGDISVLNKELSENEFENCFLVCGGPPCQGFSEANRQRLIDDPRNHLYKEFLFFLKSVRPYFFIMENVKGMVKKSPEILENFQTVLGTEYNIAARILNAKDFSVPQNRERFFVIGNRLGIDSSRVFETAQQLPQRRFVLHDAISDLPELKPNRNRNRPDLENEEIGFREREYHYPLTEFNKFINSNRVVDRLYNHRNRYNNDRDIEIFTRLPQGGNSLDPSIEDIMPYSSRNHMFKDKYFKLVNNEICKTITSHMKFDCNMYIHPTQSRGLSPREAARIQTFPDDYVFYGASNNWYKQIGNAVPVKLAESLGRAIKLCLK
ncbi:DNA cytosine methyltransferase [Sphaerochaeta sp. S2]|nr:DNA cytosine methyltransferase [Sphaerochaeta sp. S2]MBJ2354828.1 DNA cytosine methyltransferase [Sphaerochaeta sp. S2]